MSKESDINDWLDRAVTDRVFASLCSGLSLKLAITVDDLKQGLLMSNEPQRQEGQKIKNPDISISGSNSVWIEVFRVTPQPGYHSFGAWLRHDIGIAVKADPLIQAQALGALERLVELSRPGLTTAPESSVLRDETVIGGHYQTLTRSNGDYCKLHWLEAGQGIPMLFLHTAGADCRQFNYQLADKELQQRFRMLAFDMPWHGYSGGTNGVETTQNYRLTAGDYQDWCEIFIDKIISEPVVLVGCSMGAEMALTLTALRPDLVRSCIALEAPLRAPGRRSPFMADARIANGFHNPAFVRSLLSPTAPQRYRDEACAIYSQGRPGTYMGDLAYYSEEYDGEEIAEQLRNSNRKIALLTGSYDFSASPANTRTLFDKIDCDLVTFKEMPGLGHFPMIEDPDEFRPYFLEALVEI